MTLQTQTPRVVIIGNGTRGPYSFTDASSQAIRATATSHIRLTRYSTSTADNNDGSLLVEGTDYTVGGTQDARTFTLAAGQAVLTSNQRIVAERVQNYSQDLSLTTGGAFNAAAVEARIDKISEFQQELKARLDRVPALQFADATANVAFPSPPTSTTQFLARNTAGEIAYATAADLSVDVTLGSDWETILGLPAAGILDNLSGVRYVATYAALTALTTASGLADNAVYYTYARATEEDGGAGFWRYDSGSSTTANGGTILAIDGGGAGRFFRQTVGKYYVRWFGALGDNSTDDITAIQAAYTACRLAGGGEIHFDPGKTYIISQSIVMGSNTVTLLNGCTVKAKNPGYVGTVAGNNYQMFRNYNFTASSLTDSSIYMYGPGTLDMNSVVISGGGEHIFGCRYVDGCGVDGVDFKNGGNGTAFLACRDVFTTNCVSNNMYNCHFDHWDGSGKAVVWNCRAENEAAFDGAQGVQFTGTGTAFENRTSTDFVVEATTVKGIRNAGAASGIISNANDADSATYSFRSLNNIIEDCDLGLVFDGEGGRHFSQNDTFKSVTKCPILLKTANSDSPDDCQVHNPLLIDCDDDGNSALIQFAGTNHIVKGVKIVNTGSVLYTRIAYFDGTASNCLVEIVDGADGTTARILNGGTNCRVIDRFRRYEEGTFTPALQFGGLSTGITYSTQEGLYTRTGDTVFVTGYIVLTSKGSATGAARITLPINGAVTTQPGGGSMPYAANFSGLTSPITLRLNTGGSTAVLSDYGAAGSADVDDTNFANNSAFTFELTYKAVS